MSSNSLKPKWCESCRGGRLEDMAAEAFSRRCLDLDSRLHSLQTEIDSHLLRVVAEVYETKVDYEPVFTALQHICSLYESQQSSIKEFQQATEARRGATA